MLSRCGIRIALRVMAILCRCIQVSTQVPFQRWDCDCDCRAVCPLSVWAGDGRVFGDNGNLEDRGSWSLKSGPGSGRLTTCTGPAVAPLPPRRVLIDEEKAAQPAATTPISSAPQTVEEGDGGVEERATDEVYRLKRRDQETQDDECGVQSEARGLPGCTRKFTNGDWSLD